MDHHSRLWPEVLDEYKRGSTPEEAFGNICKQHGLDLPLNKTVSEFMNRFYDKDFDDNIGRAQRPFHDDLRSAIIGQYLKFNYAISSDKGFSNHCVDDIILNNRFKFDVGGWLDSFAITDLFNEGTKELEIAPKPFDRATSCDRAMAQIDHDLVLISGMYHPNCYLFLLQIDFNTQKCSVLDTVKTKFIGGHIITDPMNCSEFACLEFGGGDDEVEDIGFTYGSILKGRIANNRIIMNNHRIRFGEPLYFCKLEGDKIFGFRGTYGSDWHFCEFSFDVDSGQIVKSSKVKYPHYFNPRGEPRYLWSKRKLYIRHRKGSSFNIVVFDAETCVWTRTKFAGMSHYPFLTIDENEILTACANEYFHAQRVSTVYRFPMKKPDKLKYLAWSTIRRASLFFESDIYKNLLLRLPFNSEFRQFSENYVYNIECNMK